MLRGNRPIVILVAAIIGAAVFILFKSKSTKQNDNLMTALRTSSAVDRGSRAPASKTGTEVKVGIPVTKIAGEGRESLRVPLEQRIEDEIQRKEAFLNRYRVFPMEPLPGATTFEMLKLKAITKDQYEPHMGSLISEKLGFVIYAADDHDPFLLSIDGTLPVVANKSNGMLGIVTGTIVVTLKESSMAQALAQTYDLTLKYLDKEMRLAYFSAPSKTALDKVVEALQKDVSVEHVNLEIVQSKKRM